MTYVTFAVWIPGCNLGLKWCICSFEWCTSGTSGKVVLRVSEVDKESVAEGSKRRRGYADVQGAARFPIKLPVALKSGGPGQMIETENISANGVLFRMDADVPIGSTVDFTISLPANVVGGDTDVQVDCRGRVVRSFEEDGGRRGVGVVIDEYRFERG
jgi:hypothetical protein